MWRRNAGLIMALAAVVVSSCADGPVVPLPSGEVSLAQLGMSPHARGYRPMKLKQTMGSFDIDAPICWVENVPGFGDFPFSEALPVWGTGTHLGKYTGTIATTDCGWDAEDGLWGSGTFVSIAANGDQLGGTWSGLFTFQPDGSLAMDAEFLFTGGTGRFADADGRAQLVGSIDVEGGWSTAEGEIRY